MGRGGRGEVISPCCSSGSASSSAARLQVAGKEWEEVAPLWGAMADAIVDPGISEASTLGHGGGAWIDHPVSRLDTLPGVAIKYGVEVADVKRFNGLTTDLQMFALKTLRIPTPGRHPPSSVLPSPSQSRCENFARLNGAGSRDLKYPSDHGKQKATEKAQETPTMDLLRDYYGLPCTSSGVREGVEMATLSSGTEIDLDLVPMFRPPNATDSQRIYSSSSSSAGDFKPNRCGYVRESCNNLLESCWSVHNSSSQSSESSRLLKPGKKLVREGDSLSKERPIRRRTRGESGTDDANLDVNSAPPRPKDSRFASAAPTPDWQGSSEAASSGIRAAVEGLLSKVIMNPNAAQFEGGNGKPLSERVPSTGSLSVLEGITSVYRQAKAALD